MARFYPYLLLIFTWFLVVEHVNAQVTFTAAPAQSSVCVGGGYVTLGTISFVETNFANFDPGAGQTYILSVPANFEFNTGVTPSVTVSSGTGISNISVSAPTTTTFQFSYDVSGGSTGAGPFDGINITGIQIRAVTAATSGALARSGGTAIINGNGIGANVHCALTSLSPIVITSQPTANSVCAGLTNQTIFSVTATGSNLTYNWQRDNNGDAIFDDISTAAPGSYGGYTTAILTNNTHNTVQDNFDFRCIISGGCAGPVTSDAVNLDVSVATTVTSNPGNQSICSGNATFTVGASAPTNDATNIYQWQESTGGPFSNITNGGVYSGATTATLTLTNPPIGMSGRTYRCVVSNTACATTANSNSASLTVSAGPSITTQPVDATGCVGGSSSFSVVASGSFTGYQWQRSNDGGATYQNAPGGYTNTTTANMGAPSLVASQNGYMFRVIVQSACGDITSNEATLTVYSSGTVNYFNLNSTYCRNAPKDTLEGFPVGGTFSGPGITNIAGSKGVFDPLTAGAAGTKAIVYTLGCAISKNATLYDTTTIDYTSPLGANPSYPSTSTPVDLVVETVPPAGALTGTYAGTGVSGGKFYPNIAGPGGPYPVSFTFTNPSGCASKVIKPITVTAPGLGIPPLRVSLCEGGALILLDETTVDGGTPAFNPPNFQFAGYSGTGIIPWIGNTYYFNPSTPGTYTIYYNAFYDFGFFSFTLPYASETVTVKARDNIDFTLPTDVCKTAPAINLNPSPGILSGAGVPTNTISIISPASPPAGMLSGANNTTFNPSASGASATTYTVRYTYTNSDGCVTTLNKSINVFPKPPVPTVYTPNTFWGVQGEEFCYGTTRKIIGVTSDPLGLSADFSSTYTWYSNAGLVPPAISNQYYLFPTATDNNPGTYHYYVTRTVSGCVSDPLDITMTVNDAATVEAGPTQTICEGNTVTLAGTSTRVVAGTTLAAGWSSASSTAANFSPDVNNMGAVYTPTAIDINNQYVDVVLTSNDPDGTGPCPVASDFVRVFINKAASVDAGLPATYCSNSTIVLSGTYGGSTSFTTWTGPGGTTANIASPGSLTTTYAATPSEKTGSALTFTLTSNDPDGVGPCPVGTDNVLITITPEPLVDAGPNQTVCRSGSTVVNLTGATRSGGSNSATWSGGSMDFGPYNSTDTDLSTTYTPAVGELPANGSFTNSITLYLTSDDPDGPGVTGPCGIAKDSMKVFINPLPKIDSVKVIDTAFCTSDNAFQINVVMESNYAKFSDAFTDLPGGNQGISGSFFVPNIATIGSHTIRYTFTDVNNCSNSKDTLIKVYGVPKPKMTIGNYCATSPTLFDGSTSDISFDAGSTIDSYKWNFGDFNTEDDTSLLVTDNYTYSKTLNPSAKQSYTVRLTVGTDQNCFGVKDSIITIGNIPETDFSWSGICPVDVTKYVDISGFPIAEVQNYTWKFDSEDTVTGSTLAYKNYDYKFTGGTGVYDVTFKILSKIGCVDSITRSVNILDQYRPTVLDPYSTNFAANNAFWAVDGQNPSWQWGPATKTSINTGTRRTWVTDTLGTYNVSEKSYLNGPCLNFTDLDRPMVSLKIWSATQNQIAGSVLQYSTDGGLTWKVIGALGSGVNWYDSFGILGNPGSQPINQFGWTGTYPDWRIAKINLNNLADSVSVRLRIAFGSGSDALNLRDGFALDSIWVGERDKLLLVENFTNSSSASVVTPDANLNTLVNNRPNDIVAIHHHVGYPGSDPMNLRNQADPSARVFRYSVPSTLPYKVFDGNYDFGTGLDDADIDRRSLDPARFTIKLGTVFNADSVKVKARIIAKDTITTSFVVQVAVVERNVTAVTGSNGQSNFEWVATRMLPNAGGTFFTQDFAKNDSADVDVYWDYFPTEVYDANQLAVVVFIQDDESNEVYQAAYAIGSGGITTGLKNQLLSGKELFVYPNPSHNSTTISFEDVFDANYEYEVYDELGKVADSGSVEKGSNGLTISTSDFASGLYVIKIGNEQDGYAFKKLMVTH